MKMAHDLHHDLHRDLHNDLHSDLHSDLHLERQRGLALVVVLWVVALLALQVSILNLTVRDTSSLATTELATLRGEALAMAGVEMAVAHLLARNPARRWGADGSLRQFHFAGASISTVVKDEAARIDINEADAELLASLLRPYARSYGSIQQLVDRIMQWRRGDSDRRPQRGEAADHQRAALPDPAHTAPFLDPSELARVPGFPAQAAEALAARLTVYGGDGKVNPLLAPRDVLLLLPDAEATEIDRALELRVRGTEAAVPAELGRLRNWLTQRHGPAYRIEVVVKGESERAFGSAEAVVLIGKDPAAPFRILSWRYEPRMWDAMGLGDK
jgi:general secretion pathway protein K